MNKRYGKIFRAHRLQRKLSLSDFGSIGISKSSLAKFERGETDMGFDRVRRGLKKMGVSLKEYEDAFDINKNLINRLEYAVITGDTAKISSLSNSGYADGKRLFYLTTRSCLGLITLEESDEAVEILRELEYWSYFELSSLFFLMDNLTMTTLSHLIEQAMLKTGELEEEKIRLIQVANFLLILCCNRGNKNLALQFRKKLGGLRNKAPNNVLLRIFGFLSEGYYEECFGDHIKGLKMKERGISLLKELGEEQLMSYYEKKLGWKEG